MKPEKLIGWWRALSSFPGGKQIFSRLIGFYIPYTNKISAVVEESSPGRAIVVMKEKRGVRNHLQSVHAMALANLGELAEDGWV